MTINKTITTNVLEQVKSGLIIALIVGVGAFWFGMQVQKNNVPTVDNHVIVQASAEKPAEQLK